MINPYEPIAPSTSTERRSWSHGLIFLAARWLWCSHRCFRSDGRIGPWMAGRLENLERVARVHREMSLNTIAAFTPNVVSALIFTVVASKWIHSDDSRRRWCMLGFVTLVGYVVVVFSTSRWHLIPWTWSSEISNALRSTLTLIFPITAFVAIEFLKRRTSRCTRGAESGVLTMENFSRRPGDR